MKKWHCLFCLRPWWTYGMDEKRCPFCWGEQIVLEEEK